VGFWSCVTTPKKFTRDDTRMRGIDGLRTTRDSYLPFFFVFYYSIFQHFSGICFCGLVRPLQGGTIETYILGRYKGGLLKRTY
jgi:hypothetical protein